MYNKDDKDWFDILGGESVPDANPDIAEEAMALRGAMLARLERQHLPLMPTLPRHGILEKFTQWLHQTRRYFNKIIKTYRVKHEIWQPPWAGQVVGCASIPKQEHRFELKNGYIDSSCVWKSQSKEIPAHIRVSWEADVNKPVELWVSFRHQETGKLLSKFSLGTHLKGEKIFTTKVLNFNPQSNKDWGVSVYSKEK